MCCRCHELPAARNGRSSYCLGCAALKHREWRAAHCYEDLSAVTRFKSTMRSYANVYQKRGKIKKCDCVLCGDPGEEKHHFDYTQPLLVIWLCRDCHVRLHGAELFHNEQSVERIAEEWDARRKMTARYLRKQTAHRFGMRKIARRVKKIKLTPRVKAA